MGDERGQSEFNMAVSYLNRLNTAFYVAGDAAQNLDAPTWFHALLWLERELSTEMSATEQQEFTARRKKLNLLIAQNTRINAKTGRQEITSDLFDELHTYEIMLRGILKDAGLQNKMVKGGEEFFK